MANEMNIAHMCPSCHNCAVYKVYENENDDLYICDECSSEFAGTPAVNGGLKLTPYKDYAYEAITPYRGYKIKDIDDKKVVITPSGVEDADFDTEEAAKDWIDNKSSASAETEIKQLFKSAKKLSASQIEKYVDIDAQMKADTDNVFLVKFKTKGDRRLGEAKAKKVGFVVIDRTDDDYGDSKTPYWSFFSIDGSDKWLNESSENENKPVFEVRQYKDDVYGIYNTETGIWLQKGEKYAMTALANEYNDKSTGLTEAAPQLEQPTNSTSIVDMIKMGYEHGLFDKLKNVGRENAYTVDISGLDKDRIIGYFDKRKEFNREDHTEAGVHSVEFISNTLDIEVFDSWMQVYKIPQNEGIGTGGRTVWNLYQDNKPLFNKDTGCKYEFSSEEAAKDFLEKNELVHTWYPGDIIIRSRTVYSVYHESVNLSEESDSDIQSDELADEPITKEMLNPDIAEIEKELRLHNIDFSMNKAGTKITAYFSRSQSDIMFDIIGKIFTKNVDYNYSENEHGYKLNIEDAAADSYTVDELTNLEDDEFVNDSDFDIEESLAPANYNPKVTGKAYKVFKVKNGKLYPPMVANPGGEDTPVGVWLKADEGEFAGLSKTGRKQVKSIGSGTLSYRPGWHLGDLPLAKQFYRTNKETGEKEFPKDFVWAECEYVMEKDYQDDAMKQGYTKNGKFQHSLAGLPRIPENGFYRYRTNPNPDTIPWVITGAMKVERLLDDKEVAEILAQHGLEAPNRQGGNKTLSELGLSKYEH